MTGVGQLADPRQGLAPPFEVFDVNEVFQKKMGNSYPEISRPFKIIETNHIREIPTQKTGELTFPLPLLLETMNEEQSFCICKFEITFIATPQAAGGNIFAVSGG